MTRKRELEEKIQVLNELLKREKYFSVFHFWIGKRTSWDFSQERIWEVQQREEEQESEKASTEFESENQERQNSKQSQQFLYQFSALNKK